MKTIEVEITKEGNVTVHVQGVQGMKCTEITEELERKLGGQVISRDLTDEAHAAETVSQPQVQTW